MALAHCQLQYPSLVQLALRWTEAADADAGYRQYVEDQGGLVFPFYPASLERELEQNYVSDSGAMYVCDILNRFTGCYGRAGALGAHCAY